MNRSLALLVFASAAACGSETGSSIGTKNFANFQGLPAWTGTVRTTETCPGSPASSVDSQFSFILGGASGADLQYASTAGCLFQFNISGNIASLANAPFSCSTSTWTTYTLTTANGHSLNLAAAGTDTSSGQTCQFTQTGNLTR